MVSELNSTKTKHPVEHPEVHEAVVQYIGNESDACLIAYVAADEDMQLVQNLRTHLLNFFAGLYGTSCLCTSIVVTADTKW